jgi:hypothetical protein
VRYVGKTMPGMRYIEQTDQKLMKRRKRKAKGKNWRKEMEYEAEEVTKVKA